MTSRGFTVTDYKCDLAYWDDYVRNQLKPQWFIVGDETCPQTQRKHFQCAVWFENPRKLKAILKKFAPHHVECAKGTPEQNRVYCSKESVLLEFGSVSSQGQRHDLAALIHSVTTGQRTVEEILVENPIFYHQYGRTLHAAEDLYLRTQRRTQPTRGQWYYGPSGSGKSHAAFNTIYPQDDTYVHNVNDHGWWDNYTGQSLVIIDDFRGEVPYPQLLQLLDKFPCTVPRRCRPPVPFIAKCIIITSVLKPSECYGLTHSDNIDQLMRRLTLTEFDPRDNNNDYYP